MLPVSLQPVSEFPGNLYGRTEVSAATPNGLTKLSTGTAAGGCSKPANLNHAWTLLNFAQWQTGTPPVNGSQRAMNEEAGGTVSVDPGFGAATLPGDFMLTRNPVPGFDYAVTNDTILHAGRDQPVIQPPVVLRPR